MNSTEEGTNEAKGKAGMTHEQRREGPTGDSENEPEKAGRERQGEGRKIRRTPAPKKPSKSKRSGHRGIKCKRGLGIKERARRAWAENSKDVSRNAGTVDQRNGRGRDKINGDWQVRTLDQQSRFNWKGAQHRRNNERGRPSPVQVTSVRGGWSTRKTGQKKAEKRGRSAAANSTRGSRGPTRERESRRNKSETMGGSHPRSSRAYQRECTRVTARRTRRARRMRKMPV